MRGNFNTLVQGDKPVLIDFYAEWCGPCKMQTPILKEVSGEINGKVRIVKIDVDRNPALASRFNVRGVPTLILFKNGKPVWSQAGVANKRQLVDLIQQQTD